MAPPQPDVGAGGRGAVTVRPARLQDAERLAAVNVETWRDAYGGLVPQTYLDALDPGEFAERWRTRVTQLPADQVSLVAEIDGVIAGYAVGGAYRTQQDASPDEDTAGWGELFAIYADPAMQGRGAGSAVHAGLLGALAARGYVKAGLWVLAGNVRSIDWYRRRGWRPDGATSVWMGSGEPLREVRLVVDLPLVGPPRAGPPSEPAERPPYLDE